MEASTVNTDRTGLYRLFGVADVLLYVGVGFDPEQRWRDHARDKPWWPMVVRRDVEWFESRAEAEVAEQAAILAENPVFNVVRSTRMAPRKVAPKSQSFIEGSDRVVAAFRAIDDAWENYRTKLRSFTGSQADLSRRLNRSREMLRRDAMTDEERKALKRVEAERKRGAGRAAATINEEIHS